MLKLIRRDNMIFHGRMQQHKLLLILVFVVTIGLFRNSRVLTSYSSDLQTRMMSPGLSSSLTEQTIDSIQHTASADSRQQTADSRQQTAYAIFLATVWNILRLLLYGTRTNKTF